MDNVIHFKAPWSKALRTSSTIATALLGGLAVSSLLFAPNGPWPATLLISGLPLMILLGTLPFMIRGYELHDHEIVVRRLRWKTHLPLDGLLSVTGNNEAMLKSIRIVGNGGLFSYSGEFWNRSLRRYRALATDPSRAVVLRYAKRVIVITPDDPQRFIVRARTLLKNKSL